MSSRAVRLGWPIAPVGTVALGNLTLSSSTYAANATPGTVIGVISGANPNSTLALADTFSGALAISGRNLIVGATPAAGDATYSAVINETNPSAINSPKSNSVALIKGSGGVVTAYQSVLNAGQPAVDINPSDLSSISATGGLVDSIANRGSAGGQATSTGANRPGTGATTINGKNVLDMTAQHLDASAEMLPCFSGVHTVVAVFRNDEAGATLRYPWGTASGGVARDFVALNSGGVANRVYVVAGGGTAVFTATNNQGMGISVARAQLNSPTVIGTKTIYGAFNGTEGGGYNAPRADNVMDALRIGGLPTATANRLVGKLCRFMVFPRILSFDEQQIVEGALAWDYGMQASLSAGHPWISADPRAVARTYNVWALGDSLTETAFLTTHWTDILATLSGRQVLNSGKGGTTSTQGVAVLNLDERFKDRWRLIRFGRNDGSQSITPATTKANIATMAAGTGSRLIVMPVCKTYDEYVGGPAEANMAVIDAINADMASTYGANYLDIQAILVAQGGPGQPYADTTAFARGLVPGQPAFPNRLRFDQTHTNDNSQPIEAAAVWVKMQALGAS